MSAQTAVLMLAGSVSAMKPAPKAVYRLGSIRDLLGERIALSVSFRGAKELSRPFSAITTPAETNFWLNR
jgi:hypothetical protein